MSILIKNASILSMQQEQNGSLKPIFSADIMIKDDKIFSLGKVDNESEYDKIIDGSHLLAMPGLINTHGHAAMSLFRGYGDDMQLMDWLTTRVWPAEAKLTASDIAKGTLLAIVEMLKSGTTAFADMYFYMNDVAEVVVQSGMRASLSEGLIAPGAGQHDKLDDFPAFWQKWQGAADGLITVMLGPHAPYTCNPDYLKRTIAMAKKYAAPIHIHLAETQTEVAQIEELYQRRPVQLMAEIGLFEDNKVLAAHGVFIDDDEIKLLLGHDISIAYNPRSNMKLGSGIAPVAKLLEHGINVSIGTDSACSNNNLDMFQEMRTAALLAKVSNADPTVLPAGQALLMATLNGAKALGYEDVGVLKEGMKADLILLNLDQPHLMPPNDLISHLVYAASGADVDSVIINGRLLMEKRQLLYLDAEKIMADASVIAKRICS
ncbi:MAG: amidohydrolase [Bacillota bacterium]